MNAPDPVSAAGHWLKVGQPEQAVSACRTLLQSQPGHPEARRLLAIALIQTGEADEAVRILKSLSKRAPKSAAIWTNLGSAYAAADRDSEAKNAFQRALKIKPGLPAAHFNLARLAFRRAHFKQAGRELNRLLKVSPDHRGALLIQGHVLKAEGELEASAASYRRLLKLTPESGDAWWSLANIKSVQFSDNEVEKMRQLLASDGGSAKSAVGMHFALAKALEDRDEIDAAFNHYHQGNALKRATLQHDREAKTRLGERIVHSFSGEMLASRHPANAPRSNAPIFVVSLPRSGSTLVEQILASHSQVNGANELGDLGQLTLGLLGDGQGGWNPDRIGDVTDKALANLGQQYLKQTRRWYRDTPRFTDKMPNNFPLAGLIALSLPGAKIINVRRHPVDNCLSCYRQLFERGHHWSYDLDDLASYYRFYDRVTGHWEKVIPNQLITVHYEELLADLERQVRRILGFCQLPFEEQCLSFHKTRRTVRTASAGQVRQALYQSASGRWRRFAKHLGPLLALEGDGEGYEEGKDSGD